MASNFTKEDAYKNLDRINFWISNCDSKSSFVLAFLGIFTPLFFTSAVTIDSIKFALNTIMNLKISVYNGIIISFSTTTIIFFIYHLFMALYSMISSLSASIKTNGLTGNITLVSNLFFVAIAGKNYDTYYNDVTTSTEEEIFNDIMSQVYINSKICTKKFKFYTQGVVHVKKSIFCFLILIVLFLNSFY